jgi:hypothetical protein
LSLLIFEYYYLQTKCLGNATFVSGETGCFSVIEPACDSLDFNNDGLYPDNLDIADFFSVFGGGSCSNDPNCNDIDFDNDGLYPANCDIASFLSLFGGGECPVTSGC